MNNLKYTFMYRYCLLHSLVVFFQRCKCSYQPEVIRENKYTKRKKVFTKFVDIATENIIFVPSIIRHYVYRVRQRVSA